MSQSAYNPIFQGMFVYYLQLSQGAKVVKSMHETWDQKFEIVHLCIGVAMYNSLIQHECYQNIVQGFFNF